MKELLIPSIFELLKQLWVHVSKRRRTQLGALLILMVIVSLAELFAIGAIFPFLGVLTAPEKIYSYSFIQPLNQILDIRDPQQLLLPLTILFGVAAITSGVLRLLLLWFQTRLAYSMGVDFSVSIYRRTLYQPYAIHLTRNTSEVIAGVTAKADGIVHHIVLPILMIISACLLIATTLFALFTFQPIATALAIGCFVSIYVFVLIATRQRMLVNSQLVTQQHTKVIRVLQEGLGGIRDVLIDGTQSLYCKIYREADWQLRRAQSDISMISVSPRYIVETFGMVVISCVAYLLAVRLGGGFESVIPIVGTLALAAQRTLPQLQQVYSSWSVIRGGQAGLRDALLFLNQPLPDHADAPTTKCLPFKNRIGLSKISFQYDKNQPWVLHELDLSILKGSRVGFIGTTGSGKSTLLDIIMALLEPSEGSLMVDDGVITSSNAKAWQMHIAHVPQAIFLTDATVAENIAFGIPFEEINWEKVRYAARRAQIATTVESWSSQYHTVVGERGIRLSGGQRQRIGIARALYKGADVIILDEATSALDEKTEHAVMESINELGSDLTILIVAHRLSTLRDCSKVVEIEGGRVKRMGSYQEMMK